MPIPRKIDAFSGEFCSGCKRLGYDKWRPEMWCGNCYAEDKARFPEKWAAAEKIYDEWWEKGMARAKRQLDELVNDIKEGKF